MSEKLETTCPHCAQHLRVSGAATGKQVRCPQCHGIIRIPMEATASPQKAARWRVRTENGKTYGPVSYAELQQWVHEGRVHARCQIVAEEEKQWIWAPEMFPELLAGTAHPYHPPAYDKPPPVSEKSRLVAGLLGLLLPLVGLHGVHRLYTGHIGLGILMFITFGGCGIWQLIDVILVFAGSVTDADGRPLRD
ncbi:MAG: TM2 domain-containing protein [Planctomycetota bacterium]